jgi:aminoglycoside phosphotransferase (APT) family kinase protein
MQVVTSSAALPEPSRTDGRIDASVAGDIARWLRAQTNADQLRITTFERLPGGAIQDNWMLDVEIDGGPWQGTHGFVLRTDALSGVSASLTRAQEYAVLCAAHAAGVIAPEPVFLCSDVDVIGRVFFIMRRIRGIAAGHRLTREALLVPDGDALAESLGANLARIHAIRPPRAELAALRPPAADHALATISEYRAYLDTLADSYPGLEWALRWCETHAPAPWDATLIHRDYRTGNYLVDGGQLTAVLDWEFAGWGDPREDIGWFSARCWRFGGHAREAGGLATMEPFLRGYESVAGRRLDRTELDYWQAMAHLRWAIIALQQAQRHGAGGERSLELALTGRIVHELEYELLQVISGGTS